MENIWEDIKRKRKVIEEWNKAREENEKLILWRIAWQYDKKRCDAWYDLIQQGRARIRFEKLKVGNTNDIIQKL